MTAAQGGQGASLLWWTQVTVACPSPLSSKLMRACNSIWVLPSLLAAGAASIQLLNA